MIDVREVNFDIDLQHFIFDGATFVCSRIAALGLS